VWVVVIFTPRRRWGLLRVLYLYCSMSRLQGDVSWEMKPLVGDVQAMQLCGQKFAYMCTSVSADASGGEIPEVVALDMVKKRVFKRYHGHKDQVTGVQVTDHQFLWTCSADSTCHCSLLKSGITALQFGSYPRQFFASLVTMLVSFGQLLSVPFVYDDSALQWVRVPLHATTFADEAVCAQQLTSSFYRSPKLSTYRFWGAKVTVQAPRGVSIPRTLLCVPWFSPLSLWCTLTVYIV